MNKLLVFGLIFAMMIALATQVSGADTTYGNATANTSSIGITANGSITQIEFEGCRQVTPNSTDLARLQIDGLTGTFNETQIQWNCSYSFNVTSGGVNVTRFMFPLPDNYTNISTIQLFNQTNDTACNMNSTGNIEIQTFGAEDHSPYSNVLNITIGDVMWADETRHYVSFLFYTNATTIHYSSLAIEGNTLLESYVVGHPSSWNGTATYGGLGISNINITICPTAKTSMEATGELVSWLENGTTKSASRVDNCFNRTQDLNSSYLIQVRYRTEPAPVSDASTGGGVTTPALAVTPEQTQQTMTNIALAVLIIVILCGIGVAVYASQK